MVEGISFHSYGCLRLSPQRISRGILGLDNLAGGHDGVVCRADTRHLIAAEK